MVQYITDGWFLSLLHLLLSHYWFQAHIFPLSEWAKRRMANMMGIKPIWILHHDNCRDVSLCKLAFVRSWSQMSENKNVSWPSFLTKWVKMDSSYSTLMSIMTLPNCFFYCPTPIASRWQILVLLNHLFKRGTLQYPLYTIYVKENHQACSVKAIIHYYNREMKLTHNINENL